MKIDLHTHTVASGHAHSTIQEMAKSASEKGVEVLAITDHGPAMPGAPVVSNFYCADRIPKFIDSVRILFGVEANIINSDGEIDLPERVMNKLDFVMAGFHLKCGYEDLGVEENTEVMIKTMKNKYVKIISHPYLHKMEVDIEKIALASIEHNVILELNASVFYLNTIENNLVYDDIKKMVKILKNNGSKILINSDAHSSFEVGKFDAVLNRLDELGLEKSDLMNNDVDYIYEFLNIEK